MYWDGEKEVTKERVREIYDEELKRQGVHEMWTTGPLVFEHRESKVIVVVITQNTFDDSRLSKCHDGDDGQNVNYLDITAYPDMSRPNILYNGLVCVYRDGQWLETL